MFNMTNVYMRLVAYAASLLIGLVPAWLAGFVKIDAAYLLHVQMTGLAIALGSAFILSASIFAKWGIKPTILNEGSVAGTYMRLVTYSVSFIVGLLPAGIAKTVLWDAPDMILTIDLPSLGIALAVALGVNLSVFQKWGLPVPPAPPSK